jgi:hypothetical protein
MHILTPLGVMAGGYTIYVTAHGDRNYSNELKALPDGARCGHLDVFFRIYVEGEGPWEKGMRA